MQKAVWFSVIAIALAFSAGQAFAAADGAKLFASKCALCHGKGGEGTTMAPALKGSDFIKGDAAEIKKTVVEGRKGDQKKYPKFPSAMPPFKVTDEEADAIVAALKAL